MTARWMRFLRAIVAVLALLAVRPAIAAPPVVDQVVLVAQAGAPPATAAPAPAPAPLAAAALDRAEAPSTAHASPTLSSFVIHDTYLRHCALLR